MAADILLYDTDRVPVGDDQRQHLELDPRPRRAVQLPLRRDLRRARGDLPRGRRPGDGPPGARPTKMSKSDDTAAGTILLLDDPKVDRAEDQAGGHRHRRRGPLRPRRPSRACRTCCRSSARATGRTPAEAAEGYTPVRPAQGRHRRRRGRAARPRSRPATASWRPTRPRPSACCAGGAAKATRDRPPPPSPGPRQRRRPRCAPDPDRQSSSAALRAAAEVGSTVHAESAGGARRPRRRCRSALPASRAGRRRARAWRR